MSKNLDLKITGNPFIDAGIFALKGMLDKSINNITIEDIENEAKFIGTVNNFGDECLGSFSAPSIWF